MKWIILIALCLLFIVGMASAYQVNIDAPESLSIGKPLFVTGTTTLGIGTPIDVVLYSQLTTSTEVERKVVYVLSDKTFKAIFDTSNLKKGTYKILVPSDGLESSSMNMRLVRILDGSSETVVPTTISTVTIATPTTIQSPSPTMSALTTVPTTIPTTQQTTTITISSTIPTTSITTGQTTVVTTKTTSLPTTVVTTIPTTAPTPGQTTSPTTLPTTAQTTIKTPTPTPTPNYDAKIAALESQLAVQNRKIEEQGNILDKITNFLRNIFGWNIVTPTPIPVTSLTPTNTPTQTPSPTLTSTTTPVPTVATIPLTPITTITTEPTQTPVPTWNASENRNAFVDPSTYGKSFTPSK